MFNYFMTKSLRKIFLRKKLDFLWKFFSSFPLTFCFLTNMESNADVTLQFEDIAVQNYLFLKYVCICL